MPAPVSIDPAIREYYRNLKRYADRYIELVTRGLKTLVPDLKEEAADELPKPRMDANIDKKVMDILKWTDKELSKTFPDRILQTWAKGMISHVSRNSKKDMQKTLDKVGIDAESLMHNRGLTPYLQNCVDQNVGLIRSMTREKRDTFKNGLVAMITADAPQDQIRQMIQKHYGTTRAKARILARDQTGKLNGQINRFRQEQLGGKRYVWRGAMDSREREDHKRLQGKIFRWDDPPIVDRRTGRRGHPGEDYQCRCRAELFFPDILD